MLYVKVNRPDGTTHIQLVDPRHRDGRDVLGLLAPGVNKVTLFDHDPSSSPEALDTQARLGTV